MADPDLVGQWHLDRIDGGILKTPTSTPDSSGHGLTGINVRGSLEAGRFDGALKFANTGDGVDVADDPLLRPNRMTVMAWVKHTANPLPLRYRTLVGKGADGCSSRQYTLDIGATDGGLRFAVRLAKSSGDSFVRDYVVAEVPAAGIWDGQWHAIAGTYDGATARLWVDGVQVSSAPVPAGYTNVDYISPGDNQLSFGRYVEPSAPPPGCDQNGFQYLGAIDEVRIYNRALSAEEIAYLQRADHVTPASLPIPTAGNRAPSCPDQAVSVAHDTAISIALGCADPDGDAMSYSIVSPPAHGTVGPADANGHLTYTPTQGYSGPDSFTFKVNDGHVDSNVATVALAIAAANPPPEGGPTPTASFAVRGQSLKLRGAVRLSALSSKPIRSDAIVDYKWQFLGGDGTVDVDCGKSPVVSHAFLKTGSYRVLLTVTDAKGRQASTIQDAIVQRTDIIPQLTDSNVFDCENPAAGEQPSSKDCVKSFGFGIVDVNSRGRPSDCFEITPRDNLALVKGPAPDSLRKTTIFNDYQAKIGGPVAINGIYIWLPEGVKTEYDSGEHTIALAGASSIPVRVGPFLTQKIPLNLKVEPNKKGVVHLIDVDEAFNTPALLGSLPVRGALSIDLINHASKVKVGVGLPSIFSFGKKAAQGDAYLISDNVNGVHWDGVGLLVPEVWVGPIYVSQLSLKYLKSQNLWEGGAKIALPGSTLAINAASPPPDFGFGLKNGRFDHAGFGVEFGPPTQPDLFPPFHTVLLTHIGAAIGIKPLRLTGTIGISASNVVDEDGVLFAAFATPSTPYDFPDNVGDELAPLAGRTLDSFTLAIGGTAKLKVPILGAIPLLNAYGLYEYPDYFEFGGGFSFGISFLKLDGGVNGFVFPSNRSFNIEAGLKACLRGIKIGYKWASVTVSPCLNVGAVVSSKGLGFCGIVPVPFPIFGVIPVSVGVGYRWGDRTPDPMIFWCDYGPYRETSPRAAAAGAQYSIALPPGLPAAMIRIRGQGASPSVSVTDPRGRDIAGSGDAMTLGGTDANTTLVALRHPAAGRWTITAKPDSAPIVSVASSNGLPSVGIKARVSGRGLRRVLAYRLTPAAGRTVTFAERGPRTVQVIGVARGRSGRITFTPGRGRSGRRSIVAMIDQAGAPARVVAVASYTAPPPGRPGRPGHLRATRRKRTITATWTQVPGVARYEVLVALADGSEVFRVVRGTRASLPDPFPGKRGSILVNALAADGSRGAASSVDIGANRPGA
jgi:PKD repeat protein